MAVDPIPPRLISIAYRRLWERRGRTLGVGVARDGKNGAPDDEPAAHAASERVTGKTVLKRLR